MKGRGRCSAPLPLFICEGADQFRPRSVVPNVRHTEKTDMSDVDVDIKTPEYRIIHKSRGDASKEDVRDKLREHIRVAQRRLMDMASGEEASGVDEQSDAERRQQMFLMALRGDQGYRDLLTDEERERMILLGEIMTTQQALVQFDDMYSTVVN